MKIILSFIYKFYLL